MITLSESAKKSLEDYLRQARAYLRGSRSVDANEIEQNITEHIENELEGTAEPVSYDVLDAVLKKLGSPQQWVPMEEMPWWWKIIYGLRNGPEDWRLAYISFALLVAGLLMLSFAPAGIILILAGFLASRAALAEAPDIDKLKARKWLLYPSLIIVYVFVLLVLLSWPAGLLFSVAEGYERDLRYSLSSVLNEFDYWVVAFSIMLTGLGLWWSILAAIVLKPRKLLQLFFWPFAEAIRSKWAIRLLLIGLALMILSTGTGILYCQRFI